MAVSSQGLTFTFGGTTLSVTNVQVNESQDLIDATDLGVAQNSRRIYVGGFASDAEVTIEYFGNLLTSGASGALAIAGPLSYSGVATVSSSSVTAAVGDLVRGSASFRVR
jgi:hypothetical protein